MNIYYCFTHDDVVLKKDDRCSDNPYRECDVEYIARAYRNQGQTYFVLSEYLRYDSLDEFFEEQNGGYKTVFLLNLLEEYYSKLDGG